MAAALQSTQRWLIRWPSSLEGVAEAVGTLVREGFAYHTCGSIQVRRRADEQVRRRAGELPDESPAPIMKRKSFKELGTLTPQAEQLAECHTELTPEQLWAAGEREQVQKRLEESGEIDRVGDSQPKGDAPSFDSLVGKVWRRPHNSPSHATPSHPTPPHPTTPPSTGDRA